jgi:GT2 family glycosyltransferase/glycosyltransferase involved in cell wall biosynthesis
MKRVVIFRAPVYDMSGYANFSRRLIRAFAEDPTYDVLLEPLMWSNSNIMDLPSDLSSLFDRLSRRRAIRYKATLIHISIAHEFKPDCGYNIGYTMLETDRITHTWRLAMNSMHEIWVPSTFNRRTFLNSGVTVPVRVLPLSVDSTVFQDQVQPLEIPEITTKFNFLTLGQLGAGELDRKGIAQLIHVFLDAFKGRKDVGLIVKTYFSSDSPVDREMMLNRLREIKSLHQGDLPPVYLLHGILTEEALAGLYRFADVGIFPTHGEGSGLHIQECILCGTPVIATGWSAQMDYLDPKLTRILPYELAPVPRELLWPMVYEPGQHWAQVKSEDIAKEMKRLVDVPSLFELAKANLVAQRRRVKDHCDIHAIKETADRLIEERGGESKSFLIDRPVVDGPEISSRSVAVVIPCWNLFNLTRRCVLSVLSHTGGVDFKVVLVDNGSNEATDETLKWARMMAKDEPRFHLIENGRNLGFAKANNIGAKWAREQGDCDLLFLNNDCYVDQSNWLQHIQATCLMNPEVGVVGCKLTDGGGVILHAGTRMPLHEFCGMQLGGMEKDRGQYDYIRIVQGVVGACMYIRGELFDQLGGFDENYFAYFEDTDFCFQAQEVGWLTAYDGRVMVVHDQNSTITSNENPQEINFDNLYSKSRSVFLGKWERKLKAGVVK